MKTLVVGLGARDRGDDAVGLAVADRLGNAGCEADVLKCESTELDLLSMWDGYDRVIIIDAMQRGDPPGTIDHLDDATWRDVYAGQRPGSHAFGLAETLDLAARLHCLPPKLEIHLVQVDTVEHGVGLSPPVDRAVDALAEAVCRSLD